MRTIQVIGCENALLSRELATFTAQQAGITRITAIRLERTEQTGRMWNAIVTGEGDEICQS